MQLGILGFAKSGKTTLFNLLTGAQVDTGKFSASTDIRSGIATVPDRRLEQLRSLYGPKRFTPATVGYVDIPGVKKGTGSESLDLAKLRQADALMFVVRAFEDPDILHPAGSVDPARDIEHLDLELILADLEVVSRRLDRLEQARKRGLNPTEASEMSLLSEVILPALGNETPLREIPLKDHQELMLRGFQLLSAKPLLVAINVDESQLSTAVPEQFGLGNGVPAFVISAPIEGEIARLDGADQQEFLADIGLSEPSLDRIIRASYTALGLISFFTVGEDEVRAWTIRDGTRAKGAAGAIHSDLERGFIRAEVVSWQDLVRLKSLPACRDEGLLRLEGKEYRTRDGDVMHIRSGV